jgi:hypothetical protein
MTIQTVKVAKELAELKIIAKCRIAAFPDSLSSKLGITYVVKMLSMYLENRNFIIYIEENNECVGFVTALVPENEHSCSTRGTIDFTFNDLLLGIALKPWLFFHPIVLGNFKVVIETFKKKFKKKETIQVVNLAKLRPEIINSVGLIDIAVNPKFQNKGFSTKLLKAFEKHCVEIGKPRMHLSVKPENTIAINSYKKNGWEMFLAEPKQLNFHKEIK